MFRKKYLSFVAKFLLNKGLHPELLLDPHGNGLKKGRNAFRRVSQITFQDALKLQKGLVVKRDDIKVFCGNATFLQAVFNRERRETRVVLLAGKTLFLRRRDNFSVAYKTRGAIMIKC
ncbi:MAG: hypothetical protein BWY44_00141 [Candidatus Omnitrophica bacterium ADurb.Bin292]|nr:MAG: hypothetical protein BWY44_00141 [Candidatus Omnitrophica bacterium ADurb.Bin292]